MDFSFDEEIMGDTASFFDDVIKLYPNKVQISLYLLTERYLKANVIREISSSSHVRFVL